MKKLFIVLTMVLTVLVGLGTMTPTYASNIYDNYPSGKNYLDEANTDISGPDFSTIENIAVKPNTTYSYSWVSVQGTDYAFELFINSPQSGGLEAWEESSGFSSLDLGEGFTRFYVNFTTDAVTETISIWHSIPGNWSQVYSYYDFKWQLEEGTVPTVYEEYQMPVADGTPPLIEGSTTVWLVNVDNPTTVNSLKSTLTATDDQDGDVTSSITVTRDLYTGNEDTLGDYEVDFTATDSSGNSTTITVIFRVVDVADPVINLVGGSTQYVEYGSTYTELGYSASDNYDTSVSVTVTGTVNDSVLGTYYRYYNATDTSGNTANEVTRTVIVRDTTKPLITLNGSSTVYVEYGSNYTELNATWTDLYDGSGTAIKSGTVNVGVLGTYYINYNYTDSNGNVADQVTRTVIVRDTTAPTITSEDTYNFSTSQNVTTSYIVSLITASDLYDGDLSDQISVQSQTFNDQGNVDGSYTITVAVSDSNGNQATKTITVLIADNEKPVFTTSATLLTQAYADSMTQQDLKEYFGVS